MKRGIIVLCMAMATVVAPAADLSYHFPKEIPQGASGVYLSEHDLATFGTERTVCGVREKTRKSFFRVYGISQTGDITVRGVEGDGFAVDRNQFQKWNLENVETGRIVDDHGEIFIKISHGSPTSNEDMMKPAQAAAWRTMVEGLVSEPDGALSITDQGILYHGFLYSLREPQYWMKGQRSWLRIDQALIGDANPSWLTTEYSDGVMHVMVMKDDPNSDLPMDSAEVGRLVPRKE